MEAGPQPHPGGAGRAIRGGGGGTGRAMGSGWCGAELLAAGLGSGALLFLLLLLLLLLVVLPGCCRPLELRRGRGEVGSLPAAAPRLPRRPRRPGARPPPYPNGWYRVLDSAQLPPGTVRSLSLLGESPTGVPVPWARDAVQAAGIPGGGASPASPIYAVPRSGNTPDGCLGQGTGTARRASLTGPRDIPAPGVCSGAPGQLCCIPTWTSSAGHPHQGIPDISTPPGNGGIPTWAQGHPCLGVSVRARGHPHLDILTRALGTLLGHPARALGHPSQHPCWLPALAVASVQDISA